MASYDDVAKRWVDIVLGKTDKRPLQGSRMPVRGDKIYSYGSHFELARLVTPKRGTPFFLLNGDTYSVTTARHQRVIRDAVDATGVPSVIVPHSAMASAGINPDSIVPVAIDAERTEHIPHTLTMPDGMAEAMREECYARARVALAKLRESDTEYSYASGVHYGETERKLADGAKIMARILVAGYQYGERQEDCGACDGTGVECANPNCHDGKVTSYSGWRVTPEDEWRMNWYRNGSALTETADPSKFRWETYRHHLGASVFRATVHEYRERELFRILARDDDGSAWTTGVSRSEVREGFMGTGETWNVYRTKDAKTRRAYFVSAFDIETGRGRPLYFLAELPKDARPQSVADALDALAPGVVRDALAAGLAVHRQGDVFAIPSAWPDYRPIPFRFPAKHAPVPLDGTGRHIATELVTLPGGRVFARGTLRHAEHKTVKLGKTWHELHRNRVPLNRPGTHPNSPESGRMHAVPDAPRAWTIHGRVD